MTLSFSDRHLHSFWVVGSEGGMARAAARLGMAVQNVSTHVRVPGGGSPRWLARIRGAQLDAGGEFEDKALLETFAASDRHRTEGVVSAGSATTEGAGGASTAARATAARAAGRVVETGQ